MENHVILVIASRSTQRLKLISPTEEVNNSVGTPDHKSLAENDVVQIYYGFLRNSHPKWVEDIDL